jgi:Protein of unknown function (DUF3040)
MSLSASEQQALDSIEATLTSSDPKLASLLAIFARLASESAGLRGLLELAVLRVSDGRGPVKLNTGQGIDARLATPTLAKAGQASWCSGGD